MNSNGPFAQFAVQLLQRRGWLRLGAQVTADVLNAALAAYQDAHQLPPSGKLDAPTLMHLKAPRFCSHPDVMPQNFSEARWPDTDIPYFVVQAFPGLTLDQTWSAFDQAFGEWARVSGIKPRRASNLSGARIVATTGQLDGPGGTLAESELPMPGVRVCHQTFDVAEDWSFTGAPDGNPLEIIAWLCILHETGHALGIPHIGNGNVMAPVYNPSLTHLQAGDIAEITSRYGAPVVPTPAPAPTPTPAPVPTPTPVPASGDRLTLTGKFDSIEIPGWRVARLPS